MGTQKSDLAVAKVEKFEDPIKPDLAEGESSTLDEGELFLRENNISNETLQELLSDDAQIREVVRKVDMKILPLLAGTFIMQFIDKQALAYAAVFDLFSDTKITQTQYSWFASMFYIAYLVAEYPWTALAQRTRMAKVISSCVIAWGGILMATAASTSFGALAACRFLLGVFEAPITPCFMMIVGMWYVREEQPFRAGIFYSCNGIGSMFGGLLSYAIGQIKSFPVWKAIFLLCGGITVLWGILLFFFLPDSVLQAKRFTVHEKASLIGRSRAGQTGVLNRHIRLYQIREALLDPQGIVKDPLKTTALGIPQGAFRVFWILTGTYFSSRFRNIRTYIMMLYMIPTVIGTALMWKLDRNEYKTGVLVAYYICGSFVSALVVALQMPASNLGGYTKRVTGTAVVFAAYCVGNIIGPHAFLEKEAPTYPTGCVVVMACSVGQVVVAFALRMLLVWRNKKRDQAAASNPAFDVTAADYETDLTDLENPRFRYVL